MSDFKLIFVATFLIVAMISCTPSNLKECKTNEIKTLFTIPGIYDGKVSGFSHYVLIKNFPRRCMDSTTMVDLSLKYSDTVSIGRPSDMIMFFNSDKDFIPNEKSQVMAEINKSCLVVITLDTSTMKPSNFIFYDENGQRSYSGKEWRVK